VQEPCHSKSGIPHAFLESVQFVYVSQVKLILKLVLLISQVESSGIVSSTPASGSSTKDSSSRAQVVTQDELIKRLQEHQIVLEEQDKAYQVSFQTFVKLNFLRVKCFCHF